jgi:hypothetical protein
MASTSIIPAANIVAANKILIEKKYFKGDNVTHNPRLINRRPLKNISHHQLLGMALLIFGFIDSITVNFNLNV